MSDEYSFGIIAKNRRRELGRSVDMEVVEVRREQKDSAIGGCGLKRSPPPSILHRVRSRSDASRVRRGPCTPCERALSAMMPRARPFLCTRWCNGRLYFWYHGP